MARKVRVSVASMWQRFHGCEPGFIRDVCHGKCCDAPTRPTGTLITIHRSEEAAIRARGQEVVDGLLVTPDRVCPFKTGAHLCSLHDTPDKPFGCVASPFTLNRADCLIVRNRYRMLPCYARAPRQAMDTTAWPPAFVAFRASLDLIFGEHEAAELVAWLEAHGPDPDVRFVDAWMFERSYDMLRENDDTKKSQVSAS
jgi:hypothetical protein